MILEISRRSFGPDCRIAVGDPVYPVYVDTNVMAGRTGTYDPKTETWSNVIYMPCTAENGFVPELPKEVPDMIYLCFPNNPTGAAITKDELQKWVDYANKNGAVIIYDALHMKHISQRKMYHTVFLNVKEQEPVQSNLEVFLRMPDLQEYVLAQQSFRKTLSVEM